MKGNNYNKKHGLHGTKIYMVWLNMKRRCYSKKAKDYKYYGGRGIKMCKEWADIFKFKHDMGDPPEGMTIDRIDNDKDYSKENCRWATMKQQNKNRRSNVMIEYHGAIKCLTDWATEYKINRATLSYRIKAKWDTRVALNKPARKLRGRT